MARGRGFALWNAIVANPGVAKLAANPLLLTIIALANYRGMRLPDRRVELYQIATETLLENWPLRQRARALRAADLLRVLEPVALSIVAAGAGNAISERELLDLLESALEEVGGADPAKASMSARDWLGDLADQTGFLLERGYTEAGERVYGFLHLTFAEYLAGRHIVELWSADDSALRAFTNDARWREALLLAAGHVGAWSRERATQFVDQVRRLGSAHEVVLHRDLLLAADMLSDNVDVRRELFEEIVAQLARLTVDAPHELLAGAAIDRLAAIARVRSLGGVRHDLAAASTDSDRRRVRKLMARIGVGLATGPEILSELVHEVRAGSLEARVLDQCLASPPVSELTPPTGGPNHPPLLLLYAASEGVGRHEVPRGAAFWLLDNCPDVFRMFGRAASELEAASRVSGEATPGLFIEPRLLATTAGASAIADLAADDNSLTSFAFDLLDFEDHASCLRVLTRLALDADSPTECQRALAAIEQFLTSLNGRPDGPDDFPEDLAHAVADLGELKALLGSVSDHVRVAAFRVLAARELNRRADAFSRSLVTDGLRDVNPEVRCHAMGPVLFGRLDLDTPLRKAIARLARGDQSSEVRAAAVHTLMSCRAAPPDMREALMLVDALGTTDGSDVEVSNLEWRLALLLSLLGVCRDPRLVPRVASQARAVIAHEARRLDESELDVRPLRPLRVSAQSSPVVADVVADLFSDPNAGTKFVAAKVWERVRTRDDRARFTIRTLATDASRIVRASAMLAVRGRDLADEVLLGVAARALEDPDAGVRLVAAEALMRARAPAVRAHAVRAAGRVLATDPTSAPAFAVVAGLEAPDLRREPRLHWWW